MCAAIDNEFNNANGMNPIIFSKKVALEFAKKSKVLELLTNDQWEGEIKAEGDRVRIVLPNVKAIKINKGDICPIPQGAPPEALDLVIDKTMSFALAITDKEKAQTQFKNWEDGMAAGVAENIAIERAKEVMGAVFDYNAAGTAYDYNTALPTGTTVEQGYGYTVYNPTVHPLAAELGTDAAPLQLTPTGVYQLVLQAKMALLKSGAIRADGTYNFTGLQSETKEERGVFVCGDEILALLLQAYQLSFRGGDMVDMVVKDGMVTRVAGLDVFYDPTINEIASVNGAGTTTEGTLKAFTNCPFIAGTKNAITKASQISKVETLRDPNCFQTNIRGLELYGFKLIHPECLVRGVVKKPAATDIFSAANASIPVNVTNTADNPVNTKEAPGA